MREWQLLGVRLHPMTLDQAVEQVQSWASGTEPAGYVCLTAAHSLMTCRSDPATRRAFAGSIVNLCDGMPLVWLSRLRGFPQAERVYAGDLLLAVCRSGLERGLRHYFYGGAPGVAEELAARLSQRFPGLQVAGTHSPPFRQLTRDEDRVEIARINLAQPAILWVALGTGKQERWMHDHQGEVTAPLMISVGAAFDFLSGNKPQAPPWMQRAGLEWLHRLATEPRRLWWRYASYPLFTLLAACELLGLRPQVDASED